MGDELREVEARLASLAARTEEVWPRAGFAARVEQALEAEAAPLSSGWGAELFSLVARSGRVAIAVGTVAAILAVAVAARSQNSFDSEAAVAYGAVEVGW